MLWSIVYVPEHFDHPISTRRTRWNLIVVDHHFFWSPNLYSIRDVTLVFHSGSPMLHVDGFYYCIIFYPACVAWRGAAQQKGCGDVPKMSSAIGNNKWGPATLQHNNTSLKVLISNYILNQHDCFCLLEFFFADPEPRLSAGCAGPTDRVFN